jgi:hypothetical protein
MASWAMVFYTIPFLAVTAILKHRFRQPNSSSTWRTISIGYVALFVVAVVNYGHALLNPLRVLTSGQ